MRIFSIVETDFNRHVTVTKCLPGRRWRSPWVRQQGIPQGLPCGGSEYKKKKRCVQLVWADVNVGEELGVVASSWLQGVHCILPFQFSSQSLPLLITSVDFSSNEGHSAVVVMLVDNVESSLTICRLLKRQILRKVLLFWFSSPPSVVRISIWISSNAIPM